MIGDNLFNIAHAAVAEFDRVFVYDFMELVVCCEASAEECDEFFYQCWWQRFAEWGVKPSDLPSYLFVVVFFCIICEGLRFFLGRCHWMFLLFCSGWFLCWCILVPPCVHCFSVHF